MILPKTISDQQSAIREKRVTLRHNIGDVMFYTLAIHQKHARSFHCSQQSFKAWQVATNNDNLWLGYRPRLARGAGAKPLTGVVGCPPLGFPLLLAGEGGQGDEVAARRQETSSCPTLESREWKDSEEHADRSRFGDREYHTLFTVKEYKLMADG